MKDRREPKRFVKSSYNRSNEWALSRFKKHLIKNGYSIIEKEQEDYELDIKAVKGNLIEFYECETKTGYPFHNQDDFKFSTVSFLARKKKWVDVGFWYVIICRETSAYLKCHSNVIFKDDYFELLNITSQKRMGPDEFYRVPKHLCEWLTL